jgi:hypothetical protein
MNLNINRETTNAFNQYLTTIAENLLKGSQMKNCSKYMDPISYLRQNFKQPSITIKLKNTNTHEIGKIIQSMKLKDSHGYDERKKEKENN